MKPTPVCPSCNGIGRYKGWRDPCHLCKGRRYVRLTDADIERLSRFYEGQNRIMEITVNEQDALELMRFMHLKPKDAIEVGVRHMAKTCREYKPSRVDNFYYWIRGFFK